MNPELIEKIQDYKLGENTEKSTIRVFLNGYISANLYDTIEGTTIEEKATFYDRIEINTPWGKAFTYIYVNELSKDSIVESGDWVAYKNEEKSWSSVTNN